MQKGRARGGPGKGETWERAGRREKRDEAGKGRNERTTAAIRHQSENLNLGEKSDRFFHYTNVRNCCDLFLFFSR